MTSSLTFPTEALYGVANSKLRVKQGRDMTKRTIALYMVLSLTDSSAETTGMIGKPISMLNSAFCKSIDCGLVGRQRITSDVVSDVFVMSFHRQDANHYPQYGSKFEIFTQNNIVVSARIHALVQDDPFLLYNAKEKGSMVEIGSDFLQIMTGKRPTFDILDMWQKSFNEKGIGLGRYVKFAGYRLTTESTRDSNENVNHVTLTVLK
jgi:hypothetical protein